MVMVASRTRSWGWMLGVGTFAGITLVVPAVEAQVYMANHQFFLNVTPRYALAFLPWAIICLAVVAARRRLLKSSYLFVSLGVLVLLLAETQLLTLGPALVGNAKYLVG
jgi:cytochrome bd-type quinol oxidase subunit 2